MGKNNRATVTMEPGKQEIVITRIFNAPRDLVFRMFMDPNHIHQWWGPKYLATEVDMMEARVGGRWRFVQHDAGGKEFAFHGVYHDITPPERIIDTFEFEGLPEKGHVSLETFRLESLPGDRTKLTTVSVFQSVADRDGMAQSGMEQGINETYDRLEELLAKQLHAKGQF